MTEDDPTLPDLRYVRELARVFKQYELDEIEIETGDRRISMRRGGATLLAAPTATLAPAPPAAAAPAATRPAAAAEPTGDFITSPFVGTFYRAPRPDAANFVELGATVQAGDTVCIVEAMKLFNEIEAEFPCVIEQALVENGQAVEYGAKLFRVKKL
jgi:acetyl-CoA carboxylase biotin carboxyl carrier protein